MLGFTDEVTRINKFFRWWSVNIERYLYFTNSWCKLFFFFISYADRNLQRYRRAMSGRAGNRDAGRYFQKMVNSWLSAFTKVNVYIVTLCVPRVRNTSGTRAAGWLPLIHGNASLCPSATAVSIQYLFSRCLPCLSRRRTHNQTSSVTMDKCTFLRKYAFPDPCLLDFFPCFGGYYHLSKCSTLF